MKVRVTSMFRYKGELYIPKCIDKITGIQYAVDDKKNDILEISKKDYELMKKYVEIVDNNNILEETVKKSARRGLSK